MITTTYLYINSIGLVLNLVGALLLFTLPDVLEYVRDRADPEVRRGYMVQNRYGTACLVAGFALQLLANLVQAAWILLHRPDRRAAPAAVHDRSASFSGVAGLGKVASNTAGAVTGGSRRWTRRISGSSRRWRGSAA